METARLILRPWRESDRAPFAAMKDRIEAGLRERGFGLYAAELRDGNRFIGYVGLSVPRFEAHFTPCIETGWRLAADFWSQGLATEGAGAVVRHAFDGLSIPELVSFTVPSNTPKAASIIPDCPKGTHCAATS